MKYLSDIQTLRGISILFIILFHFKIVKNGYKGVDIFVQISGFIIYKQYNNCKSIISFYINRIKRIIILSYFIQITTLFIISKYYTSSYNVDDIINEYNIALLFLSNAYYYYIGNDYFLSSSDKIFLHYWYISMDLHFYFIYPFLFKHHIIQLFVFYMVRLSIKLLLNNSYSYYSVFSRVYIYLIGNYSFIYRKLNNISLKFNSFLLLVFFFFYNTNNFFLSDIVVNSFTFLYLINEFSFSKSILIKQIGNISYILYLIHYPLYVCNKQIYILFIFLPFCFLLNSLEKIIMKFMKNKNIIPSCVFIMMYYTICRVYSNNLSKKYNKMKNINNIFIQSSTSNFCCDIFEYSNKDVLLIGDSHAFRFISIILHIAILNNNRLYWKYIKAQWLLKNITQYTYNINHNFYLIILMNMISYKWMNFSLSDIKIYYTYYVNFLKYKSKYLLIYKPTPTFNLSMNCMIQQSRKIALINYNISLIPFNLNIKYNNYVILKDLSKYYCKNSICKLIYRNSCIYSDDNHLTPLFLHNILNEVSNEIRYLFPPPNNNNLSCKTYIIYDNIVPYNWHFKNKCNLKYYL